MEKDWPSLHLEQPRQKAPWTGEVTRAWGPELHPEPPAGKGR